MHDLRARPMSTPGTRVSGMRVGILDSGLRGGKLPTLFTRAGHEAAFGYARSEQKLKRLAREAKGKARAGTPRQEHGKDKTRSSRQPRHKACANREPTLWHLHLKSEPEQVTGDQLEPQCPSYLSEGKTTFLLRTLVQVQRPCAIGRTLCLYVSPPHRCILLPPPCRPARKSAVPFAYD